MQAGRGAVWGFLFFVAVVARIVLRLLPGDRFPITPRNAHLPVIPVTFVRRADVRESHSLAHTHTHIQLLCCCCVGKFQLIPNCKQRTVGKDDTILRKDSKTHVRTNTPKVTPVTAETSRTYRGQIRRLCEKNNYAHYKPRQGTNAEQHSRVD